MLPFPRITAAGCALLALCSLTPTVLRADALSYEGWGVRGGLSGDPDQFVIGAHLRLGELAENLRLEPNADIGFGDDLTVFTLNPDILYSVAIEDAGAFYFGGTLSLAFTRVDSEGESESDTDLGIAAIAGYQLPVSEKALAVDMKLGLESYPDFKVMLTYTFPR